MLKREAKQQVIVKSARSSLQELDLRGKRYEEAMKDLELYLDAAILANYPKAIIHGRNKDHQQGVHKVLRSHALFPSFNLRRPEYGNGATIVTQVNREQNS